MAQATLTVWKFDTAGSAEEASETLQQLATKGLIDIHDAATVSWEEGAKKPKTRQLSSTTASGALSGSFWGMLFGLIFFVPLLGAALGAATGALTGSLTDVGIDDTFITAIRDQLTPGTSALFLLSSDAVVGQLTDAFAGHGPHELVFTNLNVEQEAALREAFADE